MVFSWYTIVKCIKTDRLFVPMCSQKEGFSAV